MDSTCPWYFFPGSRHVPCGTWNLIAGTGSISIAVKHGETDFVIGNIIGSNIMNIVLVMGTTVLFRNIPIQIPDIIIQGIFMTIFTFGLFFLLKWKHGVAKLPGFIFVVIYIIYIYFNFQSV